MKYFKDYEVACKCGCGQQIENYELCRMIDDARLLANVPFEVTSWNRCHTHNKDIGSTPTSGHVKGEAIDITFTDIHNLGIKMKHLYAVGFNRIGINYEKKFIHVDVSLNKQSDVLFNY